MLRLFLMLIALCGTAQAASYPYDPQAMVYFNNDIGLVFDETQADIKFGMTLNEVRKALKPAAKLSTGKGERNLIFDFACNSDDCTIEDGGGVAFSFVNNFLVGIMLMTNTTVGAEKYAFLPKKIYGTGYDHKCTLTQSGIRLTGFGWKGRLKATVTMIAMEDGSQGGAVTLDFRTDKFRFNFRKSICTPN